MKYALVNGEKEEATRGARGLCQGCTEEQPSLKLKKIVPRENKMVGYYRCKCGAKKTYEHWN